MGEQNEAAPPAANQGGNPSIPLPRFQEVNERMKAAEARVAELEARLSPAPAQPAAPAAPAPAQPKADEPPPAAIDMEKEKLRLMAYHKVPEAAADAVLELTSKGIAVEDAIAVVERRNPAVFGRDTRGFNQTAHAVQTPGAGRVTPPAQPDEYEQVTATRDLNLRQERALRGAAKLVRNQMRNRAT